MAKLTITIEATPCNCGRGHHEPDVKIETVYDAEGQECTGLLKFQKICPKLLGDAAGTLIALDAINDIFAGINKPASGKEDAPVDWPSEIHPIS